MRNLRHTFLAREPLGWLGEFVRPQKRRIAGVLMLSLLGTALALAQPYLTKLLIDHGLLAGRFDVILKLSAATIAIALLAIALGGVNRLLYTDVSARVLFAMREAVFRHLLTLSPAFYAKMRTGDLMARLDGDVTEIQRFCVDSVLAGINGVAALVVCVALLVSLSWRLSLLAAVLLPAEALFLRAMRPVIERHTRLLRERASDLAGFFFETLPAVKFIQSTCAEDLETERLHRLNHSYLRQLLGLQAVGFAAGAVPGFLTSVSGAAVFAAGGYLVIGGRLTLGSLVAFYSYLGRATSPVQTLLGLYVAVQRARVSAIRVMELSHAEPAVSEPPAPVRLAERGRGQVRIEDVSFAFPGTTADVVSSVTIVIPAGVKAGVIGSSGVGKTTLIDLLQRHFDPRTGRILLDGVDLRAIGLHDLRRRITVVAQDTTLFSGSVLDNLRYAAPRADPAAVMRAAQRARVDEFARTLPSGYETDIGPRGTALSGGQRQRIAIARALLQDPAVLVLDEATSAIDLETEAQIGNEIDRLFPERTRIVVTHRPQTLANAEIVYRIVDGSVRIEREIQGAA